MIRPEALIGGPEPARVVIVAYNPAWVARFEQERDRIRTALGAAALGIEHVGSTSVPGLGAKPIIDILVIVPNVEDDSELTSALDGAGYRLRVYEPGHRMFRTPERDVHVHVLSGDDAEVQRMLCFRDRLRESAADRRAYEQLKRSLAVRDWSDMNQYAEAKGPFIEEVLRGSGDR